jgi:hypothetical protein
MMNNNAISQAIFCPIKFECFWLHNKSLEAGLSVFARKLAE